MTTINLYQSSGERGTDKEKKVVLFDKSFVLGVGILLFVVSGLIGINVYAKQLGKDNDALAQEMAAEEARGLSKVAVDNVADFQNRLDLIKGMGSGEIKINDALDRTAASLVAGVVVEKYTYNDKKGELEITLMANDYRTIATQLLNFKVSENAVLKSRNFAGVELAGIKRVEKGVEFDLKMALAK